VPDDRFLDFLSVGRNPGANSGPNEVGAIGIKAFLHEQIDMAKVDVTQVDRDLFRLARSVAEPMNLGSHCPPPSVWMVYGWLNPVFKGFMPLVRPGSPPHVALFWVGWRRTAPQSLQR